MSYKRGHKYNPETKRSEMNSKDVLLLKLDEDFKQWVAKAPAHRWKAAFVRAMSKHK